MPEGDGQVAKKGSMCYLFRAIQRCATSYNFSYNKAPIIRQPVLTMKFYKMT